MKKVILVLLLVFSLTLVFAAETVCDLSVSMVNQDPYPAVPGEYVKLVFQVDGLADPDCGQVEFELLENYPLVFDPNLSTRVVLTSGTFAKDFSSSLVVPYKVRIDQDALDGENPIEVALSHGGNSNVFLTKKFNLSVEDTRVDFEVYVKNFDASTNMITFEVLNIGKSDVQAVTLEIADENTIASKGAKTRIVGDLDSNEYTTADFEVMPVESDILLNVHYTDETGTRRSVQEKVSFNPDNFADRKSDQKKSSKTPIILVIVVAIVAVYFWRRHNKKNKKN